jgi:hypothetical protein
MEIIRCDSTRVRQIKLPEAVQKEFINPEDGFYLSHDNFWNLILLANVLF